MSCGSACAEEGDFYTYHYLASEGYGGKNELTILDRGFTAARGFPHRGWHELTGLSTGQQRTPEDHGRHVETGRNHWAKRVQVNLRGSDAWERQTMRVSAYRFSEKSRRITRSDAKISPHRMKGFTGETIGRHSSPAGDRVFYRFGAKASVPLRTLRKKLGRPVERVMAADSKGCAPFLHGGSTGGKNPPTFFIGERSSFT